MFKNIIFISSIFVILFFSACSNKERVTIIKEENKYGLLSNKNNISVKAIYDKLSKFDDIENKNIKTQHPNLFNLHWIHNYYGNDYSISKYNNKYGIVNNKNKMLVKPIYDSMSKLFNGFFIVQIHGKFGYLNDKFKLVQKPVFSSAGEFIGKAAFVGSTVNGKLGCITKTMNLKINGKYDEIFNFVNSYARTKLGNKWGYISDECEVIAKPIYDYAYDFSNSYAKVIKNGKVGYINSKGKKILKPILNNGEKF